MKKTRKRYSAEFKAEVTLALMRVIDAAFLDMPWYGSRQMVRHLRCEGHDVGRRRVRRLSNTMDAGFCVAALEEALARFGRPEIFNTDQGSQFTAQAFTSVLREAEVRISEPDHGGCPHDLMIKLVA